MLLNCSIHSRFSTCVNSISSDLCCSVLLVDMQLLLKDVAYMSKDGLQFEYLENERALPLFPDILFVCMVEPGNKAIYFVF